jgi:signal peptidase II
MLKQHVVLRFAFALILGGAFGNLIDRFLYGRVVDFLDFEFFDISIPPFSFLFIDFGGYHMTRWPVFNIADIAVTVGMIMIILNAIFDRKQFQEDIPDESPQEN